MKIMPDRKDPAAILDYTFDWFDWLKGEQVRGIAQPDDAIIAHTVTATNGLQITNTTADSNSVTAWVAGGTAGQVHSITCKIQTQLGRTDERTMRIRIEEQ